MDLDRLEELIARAREVSKNAYCPYSDFTVGAAVLTKSGKIYSGCNVENASYGLTICAERNALFQMIAEGDRELEVIVVYTPTNTATAPCGACRQVINEFGSKARIVCICDSDERIDSFSHELLPGAFGPENLVR